MPLARRSCTTSATLGLVDGMVYEIVALDAMAQGLL